LLFNAANPLNYATASAGELAAAAQVLKIQLHHLEIRSADDIERTMAAANLRRVEAVVVVGDPLTFRHRKRINELGYWPWILVTTIVAALMWGTLI